MGIVGLGALVEGCNHVGESFQTGDGSCIQPRTSTCFEHFPYRRPCFSCRQEKLSDSSIANASGWLVDDASQRLFIIRVNRKSKVTKHVLDFLALIERSASIDMIRNTTLKETVLYLMALGIGSIKHGDAFVWDACTMGFLNLSKNNVGFVSVAIGREESNRITYLLLAEDALRDLLTIISNQASSCIYNGLGGTIVALQFKKTSFWISLAKVQDIVNVGSSETVNALGIIANDTNTLSLVGKELNYLMLSEIGVLILIDENKMETLLPMSCNLRIMLEDKPSVEQQIIKIHSVSLLQALLIAVVNLWHHGAMEIGIALTKLTNRSITGRLD